MYVDMTAIQVHVHVITNYNGGGLLFREICARLLSWKHGNITHLV